MRIHQAWGLVFMVSVTGVVFGMHDPSSGQPAIKEVYLTLEQALRNDQYLPVLQSVLACQNHFEVSIEKALFFAVSQFKSTNRKIVAYLIEHLPIKTEALDHIYMIYMKLRMKGWRDEADGLLQRKPYLQLNEFQDYMAHSALIPDNQRALQTGLQSIVPVVQEKVKIQN